MTQEIEKEEARKQRTLAYIPILSVAFLMALWLSCRRGQKLAMSKWKSPHVYVCSPNGAPESTMTSDFGNRGAGDLDSYLHMLNI